MFTIYQLTRRYIPQDLNLSLSFGSVWPSTACNDFEFLPS